MGPFFMRLSDVFTLHVQPAGMTILAACLAVLAGVLGVWVGYLAHRLRRCAADSTREQTVLRLLRLTAKELREAGLRLHGQAGHALAAGAPNAPVLGTVAAQLQSLADELQEQTQPQPREHVLREELIAPEPLLREAMATLQAALHPGRRQFRISAGAPDLCLWADRRALRHIFARVLADAACNTGQDDWIEIFVLEAGGLIITIADEGAGLSASGAGQGSRGVGLRLALAASLMQAHGGALEVEARAQVGSQVSLVFPAGRTRRQAPAPLPARAMEMASD